MGYSILSLSDNQSLLSTRQYILESAAYAVTSTLGYKQAEAACGQGNYDLAIIGHSFSFQQQEALITLVRAHGDTLILVLRTAAPGQSPRGADGMFELAEGAQAFLVRVGEYNVVQLTAAGRALLKGQGEPLLTRPRQAEPRATRRRSAGRFCRK